MNENENLKEQGLDTPENTDASNSAQTECQNEENEALPAQEKDERDKQIEELQKELNETKDRFLRILAEYDNYRKRTAKEKTEAYSDAAAKVISEFLSVIDNFERALAVQTSDESFKNGMQMIFNQYCDILKKLGVEEIDALNKPFDPALHNAINQVEDENFEPNTVCQVFQKGYTLNGKVIRHAMVAVANP
ncbi:MAG TPA: nucleotide exchange factor GrpE [Oscillospiraceae bacterium]|nr:nucleotide exchange factor GrpE [Oscillospiraceae bacterium]